jgi:hypothetical protein
MAIVDPNKGGDFKSCGAGKKVMACVGLDRRRKDNGEEQYEVHWLCVKDLAAGGDVGDKGADHWDFVLLRENLYFILGQLMKAAGHAEPFDTDDKALIGDTLANCYVVVNITNQPYNGEDKFRTARNGWAPYTGAEEADWADLIAKGVENHEKLREARKKKAGGGSSGGSSQRRPDPVSDPGSEGGNDDDPIPY